MNQNIDFRQRNNSEWSNQNPIPKSNHVPNLSLKISNDEYYNNSSKVKETRRFKLEDDLQKCKNMNQNLNINKSVDEISINDILTKESNKISEKQNFKPPTFYSKINQICKQFLIKRIEDQKRQLNNSPNFISSSHSKDNALRNNLKDANNLAEEEIFKYNIISDYPNFDIRIRNPDHKKVKSENNIEIYHNNEESSKNTFKKTNRASRIIDIPFNGIRQIKNNEISENLEDQKEESITEREILINEKPKLTNQKRLIEYQEKINNEDSKKNSSLNNLFRRLQDFFTKALNLHNDKASNHFKTTCNK